MPELYGHIDIAAPIERVWVVVTNFTAYPQWNRLMNWLGGELVPGAPVKVRLLPPGRPSCTLTGRVRIVEPERRFRWTAHLLSTRLIDVQQTLVLRQVDATHTRVDESLRLAGLLAILLPATCDRTRQASDDARHALKARAESGALTGSRV